MYILFFFFFNDTATTEIYTLSLHDALPIYGGGFHHHGPAGRDYAPGGGRGPQAGADGDRARHRHGGGGRGALRGHDRSEEHTSELQSRQYLVCRLLLEKKKKCISIGLHISR